MTSMEGKSVSIHDAEKEIGVGFLLELYYQANSNSAQDEQESDILPLYSCDINFGPLVTCSRPFIERIRITNIYKVGDGSTTTTTTNNTNISLAVVHTIGKDNLQYFIKLQAMTENDNGLLFLLHEELTNSNLVAKVLIDNDQKDDSKTNNSDFELIMVPTKFELPDEIKIEDGLKKEEEFISGFLIYSVIKGGISETCAAASSCLLETTPDSCIAKQPCLVEKSQLALILGLEYTLLRNYDLRPKFRPPRDVELAMLSEFDKTLSITLPGGQRIAAVMEDTLLDGSQDKNTETLSSEETEASKATEIKSEIKTEPPEPPHKRVKFNMPSDAKQDPQRQDWVTMGDVKHPVLRLTSSQGEIVFTKILRFKGDAKGYSMIVHIRPGWNSLKNYILGYHNVKRGPDTPVASPFFHVYMFSKNHTCRRVVLELYRLLDVKGELINHSGEHDASNHLQRLDLQHRLRCGLNDKTYFERSIENITSHHFYHNSLSIGLDNSTRWSGENNTTRVWPTIAYDPYLSTKDTALNSALLALHDLRNLFYASFEYFQQATTRWLAGVMKRYSHNNDKSNAYLVECINHNRPVCPRLVPLVAKQKHRWLQEFQSHQSPGISNLLLQAKDYIDPNLRNRWHLVIDTNVFHAAVSQQFYFFKALYMSHHSQVILVIPYSVIEELDWQKHESSKVEKKELASKCISFINSQCSTLDKFIMIQSVDEDKPSKVEHAEVRPYNLLNDMRVLDCAKLRSIGGLRTLLVSNDNNLRNQALSVKGLKACKYSSLVRIMQNELQYRLPVEHWMQIIEDMELARQNT